MRIIIPLLFFISSLSFGQESVKESAEGITLDQPPLSVEFYIPELDQTSKENRSRIVISGKTVPGTKIELGAEKLALISKKNKVFYIKRSSVTPPGKEFGMSDQNGYFEIFLDLPYLTAQIPIKATTQDGREKIYQLNIVVKRNDVRLANRAQKLKANPYARKKFGLWGGVGVNLLLYSQESPDIPSELELETIKGPSLFAKGHWNINKEWTLQSTFNMSPGSASSSDSIKVSEGSYNWLIFALEGVYYPKNWKFSVADRYSSEVGLLLGVQNHIVPFMSRSGGTDATETDIATNSLTFLALGGQYNVNFNRRWSFETFMRYQLPLASGDLFDIKPKIAFDGSMGVIWKWTPNLKLGGFWYGQWHSYDFENHTDKFFEDNPPQDTTTISGEQTLFFSNIEFRIGYEFD